MLLYLLGNQLLLNEDSIMVVIIAIIIYFLMNIVANLKDSNEELRGLVAQLQKRQQETEAKLK